MLADNGDRLGAVHGASHRRETKLRQEHKHRLYEERVVVNDDDTSVPLKRHLLSPIALGARRQRPICASTSGRYWRKARLPRSYAVVRGREDLQIMGSERSSGAGEILLFDETDDLFKKRGEVRDGHDR
jgi:hypothetical protein